MTKILVVAILAATATVASAAESVVMTGSVGGARTSEICVTNAAGGTAVPTTALGGRKELILQNHGPNAIFCTLDGQAPLATGALGHRIEAATATATMILRLPVGPRVTVKCIANAAAQVSPACTQISETR